MAVDQAQESQEDLERLYQQQQQPAQPAQQESQQDLERLYRQQQPPESIESRIGHTIGQLGTGIGQAVGGTLGMAKDVLTSRPETIGGVYEKYIGQPAAEQARQASEAWRQGRLSEAFGHELAGAIPFVGPAAAGVGEQIGGGDIAGGIARGIGMFGTGEAIAKGPAIAGDVAGRATPRQVGATIGGVGGAIKGAPHFPPFGMIKGAKWGAEMGGKAADIALGKERAGQPILRRPIEVPVEPTAQAPIKAPQAQPQADGAAGQPIPAELWRQGQMGDQAAGQPIPPFQPPIQQARPPATRTEWIGRSVEIPRLPVSIQPQEREVMEATPNVWNSFKDNDQLADHIIRLEGTGSPTIQANNNPGNLINPKTGQFQKFDSYEEGRNALVRQLESWRQRFPNWTIADLNRRYAPDRVHGGDNPNGTEAHRNHFLMSKIPEQGGQP